MQIDESLISGRFRHKNTDIDYLANFQLFDSENIDYPNSISNTPQSTIATMSDDETYIRPNTNSDGDDEIIITPLILRDVQSANYPIAKKTDNPNRRRKKRSNSAMTFSSKSSRNHKLRKLEKQCKDQQSTLQIYQDKITHIQDDAEETEATIKHEYKRRILHLNAKYLQEKSEKNTLRNEVERLRQELFIIHEKERLKNDPWPSGSVAVGYSTKSPPEHEPTLQINYSSNDTTSSSSSSSSTSESESESESDNVIINTQKTKGEKKKKKNPAFWDNVWSMFGPQNFMSCSAISACSDNRR